MQLRAEHGPFSFCMNEGNFQIWEEAQILEYEDLKDMRLECDLTINTLESEWVAINNYLGTGSINWDCSETLGDAMTIAIKT